MLNAQFSMFNELVNGERLLRPVVGLSLKHS